MPGRRRLDARRVARFVGGRRRRSASSARPRRQAPTSTSHDVRPDLHARYPDFADSEGPLPPGGQPSRADYHRVPVIPVGVTVSAQDGPPAASIARVEVAEGNRGTIDIPFTVTLAVVSGKTITFGCSTATTEAEDVGGADYVAVTDGPLTIALGESTGTLNVEVRGAPPDSRTRPAR